MPTSTRYKDLLDYTVTYRSAWSVFGFFAVLGIAGYLLWTQIRPPGEDEKARQELKAAERLQSRAEGCMVGPAEGPQPSTRRLQEASENLAGARQALEAKSYAESMQAAQAASLIYKDLIEKTCVSRESAADFLEIAGDVKVKKLTSPRWVAARRDASLEQGDRIWTQNGVAKIAYRNGDTQEIREGTIIEIKAVKLSASGVLSIDSRMESGRMIMETPEGSESTVTLPFETTVTPRGDTVEMESPEGSTEAVVMSGRGGAEVKVGGAPAATLKRLDRVAGSAAGMSPIEQILPNPELNTPIDGRVFVYEKPDEVKTLLDWKAVEGATGYKFQIGINNKFLPLLNKKEDVVSVSVELPALPPNTYFWKVAARDPKGHRGQWSEVRRFTVKKITEQSGKTVARKPPPLKVDEALTSGDSVFVKGVTAPSVTLECFVNGAKYQDISVSDDGQFQIFVKLPQEGRNVISIVAHDVYGTEARQNITKYFNLD